MSRTKQECPECLGKKVKKSHFRVKTHGRYVTCVMTWAISTCWSVPWLGHASWNFQQIADRYQCKLLPC